MKKLLFLLPAIALVMLSCGNYATERDVFATDSVTVADSSAQVLVTMTVDFPTSNSLLSNAVREYINENLGGTYDGDLTDAKAMLDSYVQKVFKSLEEMVGEMGDRPEIMQLYEDVNIRLLEETDRYVTYTVAIDTYYGGAHGSHIFYGATFRKTDGRRFGADAVRTPSDFEEADGWHQLLKEGVRSYFSAQADVSTDEQLKGILLGVDNVNFIPSPQYAYYFTKDGVCFVYQQYEIAPYAAGLPSFTIPYADIRPYLTATAAALTTEETN